MWYHAIAHYGTKKRYWWNRKKQDILQDVLLPFVSQQVSLVTRQGTKALFSFAAIDYVTLLATKEKLSRPRRGRSPTELGNNEFVEAHNVTEDFSNAIKVMSSNPGVRSLLQRALSPTEKRIFVIMRIGDKLLDSAYTRVIKSVGEEFGYKVVRVDEIQDSCNITEQILEQIAGSEIILADLSGERPNCYYEAGFSHALGKQLIFTVNEASSIHFDLQGYRFIKWGTEAELEAALHDRLDAIGSKGVK